MIKKKINKEDINNGFKEYLKHKKIKHKNNNINMYIWVSYIINKIINILLYIYIYNKIFNIEYKDKYLKYKNNIIIKI